MIVKAVVKGLDLKPEDTLLDLCCGNGALSTLLFNHCNGGIGIDFSEYLISIANKYFAKKSNKEKYLLGDVVAFCENPIESDIFTKAVCYGSFSYIEHERAEKLLCLLINNFKNLKYFYIGNCPDRELLYEFSKDHNFLNGTEDNPASPIGIWRTQETFKSLAQNCGWRVSFRKMPPSFYASHYRYDVILKNEN